MLPMAAAAAAIVFVLLSKKRKPQGRKRRLVATTYIHNKEASMDDNGLQVLPHASAWMNKTG